MHNLDIIEKRGEQINGSQFSGMIPLKVWVEWGDLVYSHLPESLTLLNELVNLYLQSILGRFGDDRGYENKVELSLDTCIIIT